MCSCIPPPPNSDLARESNSSLDICEKAKRVCRSLLKIENNLYKLPFVCTSSSSAPSISVSSLSALQRDASLLYSRPPFVYKTTPLLTPLNTRHCVTIFRLRTSLCYYFLDLSQPFSSRHSETVIIMAMFARFVLLTFFVLVASAAEDSKGMCGFISMWYLLFYNTTSFL